MTTVTRSRAVEAQPNEAGQLRRAISGRMLLFFVIGDVLGAGVYALVGQVGGRVGGAIWAASESSRHRREHEAELCVHADRGHRSAAGRRQTPWLAIVTTKGAETFARAGLLLAAGAALWFITRAAARRRGAA
jgi:outer membrane lipoprotein SlyB